MIRGGPELGSPAVGEEGPSMRTWVSVPGHCRVQGGMRGLGTLDCSEAGMSGGGAGSQPVSAQAARVAGPGCSGGWAQRRSAGRGPAAPLLVN